MALKNPLIKARLSNLGCRKGFEIVPNGGKFKIRCMTDVSSAATAAAAAAVAGVLDQGHLVFGRWRVAQVVRLWPSNPK